MFEQAMSKHIKAVLIFCETISPNSRDLGMEIMLWSSTLHGKSRLEAKLREKSVIELLY